MLPKRQRAPYGVLRGTASRLAAWLTLALLGCLEDSTRFLAAALALMSCAGRNRDGPIINLASRDTLAFEVFTL